MLVMDDLDVHYFIGYVLGLYEKYSFMGATKLLRRIRQLKDPDDLTEDRGKSTTLQVDNP